MKKILILLFSLSATLHAAIYQQANADYKVDHTQNHVLEITTSLPQVGVLKMKSNGYVYLDVTNEYITKTFPNLILDGHLRPTTSFSEEEGAHITVVTDQEKCTGLEEVIGKEFQFEVKELRILPSYKAVYVGYRTEQHHTGDRWIIAVESQELEELRMKLGLPPLVNGHDFHITIGFEVPFARINNFGERPPT